MTAMETTAETTVKEPGLLTRYFGVLVSPRNTYAAVARRPRWIGIMAITLAINAASYYVMFSSEEMQDAMYAQATARGNMSDQQLNAIETFLPRLPAIIVGFILVAGPIFTAIVAGILMLIFSTLMGGSATFKQVYSTVAHAAVVSSLSGVISAALILAGAMANGTSPPGANLAVFVPTLDETSFIVKLLGAIDLILVWWLFSLSIGLGVLYKRRTGGIAFSLLCVYAVIAVIIAFVRSGS